MLNNNSPFNEIASRRVNETSDNPWSKEILPHFNDPEKENERYKQVPAIVEAQRLADELNKKDSQSLLSKYEKMSAEEKHNFELHSDKNGHLKIRLSEEFKQEAYVEYRQQAFVDAFARHDIKALNDLLPFQMCEEGRLIDRLKKSGWKVEESLNADSMSILDQKIVFTPPDGTQAIAWVQYSCPTTDGAGAIVQSFKLV